MNSRTKIFLLVIFSFLLFQCTRSPNNHDFIVEINQISKVRNDTLGMDKWKFYSIDLSLVNNTDSTISFLMWTCAWDWNFISLLKGVNIIGPECPRNFPTIMRLEKNQKMDFSGLITSEDSSLFNMDNRIGFIYLKESEGVKLVEITPPPPGADSVLLKRHNKHERIIWSDYLRFK